MRLSQPKHAQRKSFTKTNRQGFLRQYLIRHGQAAFNSISQLSRTPLSAILTCIIIGIALALPTALFILLKNVDIVSHGVQQTTQLTLYLKPEVNEADVTLLTQRLKENHAIRDIHAISPAEGLAELQHAAGVSHLMDDLESNPLPWAITVLPVSEKMTSEAISRLQQQLSQYPEVDSVQFDTQWIQRLFALMDLAHRAIYALTIFLGLGVLLIVNNCIRSATQQNQKEISVIKLIGGTKAFIRRPFLYTGMIYGLLGGILAWQLVDLLILWIKDPAHHLAMLYQSQYQLLSIGLSDTFILLISSMALGWAGAWLAVTRYLRAANTH